MEPEIKTSVLHHTDGDIGHILLNRPNALNALSLTMLQTLRDQLEFWQDDNTIAAVLIEGTGERAFCAGGDIRAVYENKHPTHLKAQPYFEIEYYLNELIFNFKKPYIAILDGIAMGGGLGVSIWGSHPIATERLVLAMPETAIGLFPDIGSSYFLIRLPKHIGWYLGLTGNPINAYEALTLGLVKTVMHHQSVPNFIRDIKPKNIITPDPIALNTHSELLAHQDDIEECFSHTTISKIINTLKTKDDWCQNTAAILESRSPLSLKVTLEYLKKSANKSFSEIMQMNTHMVKQFLQGEEFFEGIRAAVIDKDKKPKWQHAMKDVDDIDVASFF